LPSRKFFSIIPSDDCIPDLLIEWDRAIPRFSVPAIQMACNGTLCTDWIGLQLLLASTDSHEVCWISILKDSQIVQCRLSRTRPSLASWIFRKLQRGKEDSI
jgi:hypothetical protein